MPIEITSLTLYPVKSCAGTPVSRFRCGASGPEWDRQWMVVGGDGKFVTQREVARLALVTPHLDVGAGTLRLSARGHRGGVEISLHTAGAEIEVEIWGSIVKAFDEGAEAARWLTDTLGMPLRLARISKENRLREGEDPRTVSFADSYPLHLCAEESLADLNARIPARLEMNRFRPNLVVRGAPAWSEDRWTALRQGASCFRVGKRAERCVITTIDQVNASKGPEPLKTLAGFRRNARNKIEFGQYLHTCPGAELAVGMELKPEP